MRRDNRRLRRSVIQTPAGVDIGIGAEILAAVIDMLSLRINDRLARGINTCWTLLFSSQNQAG